MISIAAYQNRKEKRKLSRSLSHHQCISDWLKKSEEKIKDERERIGESKIVWQEFDENVQRVQWVTKWIGNDKQMCTNITIWWMHRNTTVRRSRCIIVWMCCTCLRSNDVKIINLFCCILFLSITICVSSIVECHSLRANCSKPMTDEQLQTTTIESNSFATIFPSFRRTDEREWEKGYSQISLAHSSTIIEFEYIGTITRIIVTVNWHCQTNWMSVSV